MTFFIRLPENFVPEEYGWRREESLPITAVPPAAAERFGTWVRERPDHPGPARESLVVCAYDEDADAYGAWFYPLPTPDADTLGSLWRRLKDAPDPLWVGHCKPR